MPIRLNDEEIDDALGEWWRDERVRYFDTTRIYTDTGEMRSRYRQTNKAQIKKVIDLLDTFEFYEDVMGESAKSFRNRLKDILLKELG